MGERALRKDVCGGDGVSNHGARLDEVNKANSTAIDIADVGPTDRAVLLITKLILAKGGYPVHPSKRGIGLPPAQ